MLPGVKIFYSPYALRDTDEPNFPPSKNRSARIRKKLLKRHGFVQVPCIWQTPAGYFAHPSFKPELERALSQAWRS
jgi:hypothetical protein